MLDNNEKPTKASTEIKLQEEDPVSFRDLFRCARTIVIRFSSPLTFRVVFLLDSRFS
jgi:hypothetical protein